MEDRKSTIKFILLFVVVAYVLSGIGYYINARGSAAGLFFTILAPIVAAFLIYFLDHRRMKLMICKFSLRGIVVGAAISAGYMFVSFLLFLLMGNQLGNYKITGEFVLETVLLYLFAGFCEEVGWRGMLLPMLKKVMKLEYACLINAIIWFGWHVPLIVGGDMIPEHTLSIGLVLFLIEVISITFIMGVLSETKMGKSIWTYVSLHAVHNIIVQLILSKLNTKQSRYFGDAGYLLIAVLIVTAIGIWFYAKKKKLIGCERK